MNYKKRASKPCIDTQQRTKSTNQYPKRTDELHCLDNTIKGKMTEIPNYVGFVMCKDKQKFETRERGQGRLKMTWTT